MRDRQTGTQTDKRVKNTDRQTDRQTERERAVRLTAVLEGRRLEMR